jgi:hypothetical protein
MNTMPGRKLLWSFATVPLIASILWLAGCGSSHGNPVQPVPTTSMQFKIGDSDSDRLLSFTVTLSSITAIPSTGTAINLLASPIIIELTRTAGTMETLAELEVPEGTYTNLQYNVSDIRITAWDPVHSAFQDYIRSGTMSGSVSLNPALVVGTTPKIIDLDLDLKNSIAFDTSGTLTINPHFGVSVMDIAGSDTQLAEDGRAEDLVGVVQGISTSSFTMSVGLGANVVQVAVDGNTEGQSFNLLMQNSLVEVDAVTRADGSLLAKRIDFVETASLALVEGVVTGPGGYPPGLPPGGDTATLLVQKTWAPPQAAVPNVGDTITLTGLTTASYGFDTDKLDSWGLGFLNFSNSSLWRGQSLLALITPGTGTVITHKLKLVEIAAAGIVQGYNPGQIHGFTLRVPADSAYQNLVGLMPQTYLSTWDQSENKTVFHGFPASGMQDGMEVRVRGLAFWYAPPGYLMGGPTILATRIDYLSTP